MRHEEYLEYCNINDLRMRFGITKNIGSSIADIVVFSSCIEFYLEDYLWKILNIDPSIEGHRTDAKPISELIKLLKQYADDMGPSDGKVLLSMWAAAAKAAVDLRNDLAHGLPIRLEEHVIFSRNTNFQKIKRKRKASQFWADELGIRMLADAMGALLRVLGALCKNPSRLDLVEEKSIMYQIVKNAAGILGELRDPLAYNPSFGKY